MDLFVIKVYGAEAHIYSFDNGLFKREPFVSKLGQHELTFKDIRKECYTRFNDICQYEVRSDYRPHDVDTLVVCYSKEDAGYALRAFLMAETHLSGGPDVEIDIVCASKGYGYKLMKLFIELYGDRSIELHALSGVLTYYQQFGFEFATNNDCSGPKFKLEDSLVKRLSDRLRGTDPKHKQLSFNQRFKNADYKDAMTALMKASGHVGPITEKHLKDQAVNGFLMCRQKGARHFRPPVGQKAPAWTSNKSPQFLEPEIIEVKSSESSESESSSSESDVPRPLKRLRRMNGGLRNIEGGWASVPKSDPELWARVLAQVKKEPGPWAAWKAVKADRIYKSRGGRFL